MGLYSTRRGLLSPDKGEDESVEAASASLFERISSRDAHEAEFLQAVHETLMHLRPVFGANRKYLKVFEILCEPERVIMFRVPWINDFGDVCVNRGYRVQFNSAIGPYKGGLRFHPSVTLSVLKFLGFDQTLKNSLTGLPLGGAKGGSDFDPKGKSDTEIRSFCQAFMGELFSHIGPQIDVPAGDIGVGEKEIGFLFGQYKKLNRSFEGSLTGKGPNWGGSLIRPEATGYGAVYFTLELLEDLKMDISKMRCAVSGSGNASQFTAEKLIHLGATVLSLSDSNGLVYFKDGMTKEDLAEIMELKTVQRGRLSSLTGSRFEYRANSKPWRTIACDIAFPAATQNEIEEEDARMLIASGCKFVMEVSNMASTEEAIQILQSHKIWFGPSKAVNAGGVAVSGLEMTQNATGMFWTREVVDEKLKVIMSQIYQTCKSAALEYGDDQMNLGLGADIAGFLKVADSIIAEGAV